MRIVRTLAAMVLLVAEVGMFVVLQSGVASADSQVASISAVGDTTCAVTTAGGAKCWGYNGDGELGNGTTTDSNVPVDVSGLTSGVSAVSASCALTTGGGVKCWGNGSTVPADVPSLGSGVAAISSSGGDTCALTTGGAVECWGQGTFGQLGNGANVDSNTPVQVAGLTSGVVGISTGGGYSCAVTNASAVKCWGFNDYGQLGTGTTAGSDVPVDVVGLSSGVATVQSGSDYTCAVMTSGALECWGRNDNYQLGDGTNVERHTPVPVTATDDDVAAVTTGSGHTCVETTAGAAECWGRNDYGQLGNAATDGTSDAVAVAGLASGVISISAGGIHTCAVTNDGVAHCWGNNFEGQLGNGLEARSGRPESVAGLDSGVATMGAGYHHTCAITDGGALWCWGANGAAQLGDGTTIEADTPIAVPGMGADVSAVVGGYAYTCAIKSGALYCWGDNASGELGDGTTTQRYAPTLVPGFGSDVTGVSAGAYHTCAIKSGALYCWGENNTGMLGDGTFSDRHWPTPVLGLSSGVRAVAAGAGSTCAVTSSGGVKCWGDGSDAGDGTTATSAVPHDVTGLNSGVVALAAGSGYACALTTGGTVKCWGAVYGNFSLTPQAVPGLTSGVVAMSGGASDMCVLTQHGAVQCWGYNGLGEVGDGTTQDASTPTPVIGLGSGVATIAAGGDHSCAVTDAGAATCWGNNTNGQLGNGPSGQSLVPAAVVGLGLGDATIATAPNGVVAEPALAAAHGSWSPTKHTGGARVYGYAVTLTNAHGGRPAGVHGPTVRITNGTSLDFRGLSNGQAYRLRVAPLNRAGMSAAATSAIVRPGPVAGYWMVESTGRVHPFGRVSNAGNANTTGVTHITASPSGRGYWVLNAAGRVFNFGDATRLPDAGTLSPGERAVALSSTANGQGYTIFTSRGRAIPRGSARSFGDASHLHLNGPIIDAVSAPSGRGYYLLGTDGGVFTFGSARFRGSMGGKHLNRPIIGIVPTRTGEGYWLVASDGGVFTFGDARFRGSTGSTHLQAPIVGMVAYGNGYLMVASDGGVFDFSNRPFAGSLGGHRPASPIVGIAAH